MNLYIVEGNREGKYTRCLAIGEFANDAITSAVAWGGFTDDDELAILRIRPLTDDDENIFPFPTVEFKTEATAV